MNASNEVIGSDANAAAQKEFRFAISETATISKAVIAILAVYCHIELGT
jgi:hypothetical protein